MISGRSRDERPEEQRGISPVEAAAIREHGEAIAEEQGKKKKKKRKKKDSK